MSWKVETLGNASLMVLDGDRPVLMTDPWLYGTVYFGSWALEQPPDATQMARAAACRTVWISHGHPDHLHLPSLAKLHPDCEILLPDHYHPELKQAIEAEGRRTRVMKFKEWATIEDGVRAMCVQNENMDAILAVEVDGVLFLDKNDSPFCGEDRFFRKLVRGYDRSYLLALCAFDADMLNLYDAEMRFAAGPPDLRKPGTIWAMSRICDYLGVTHFCCSSSQHVYVRKDSAWANAYRVTWADIQKYWCARTATPVEPFVTIDVASGAITRNAPPGQPAPIVASAEAEDWEERASEEDWAAIERFVRKFATLRRHHDFVGFVVGGEARRFGLSPDAAARPTEQQRGAVFHVPRASLMQTVEYGYFDDLLIGNFMKTQLHNMALYPHFTPTIAKLGGNAKVFTAAELRRFQLHFLRLSPLAFLRYRIELWRRYAIVPALKECARRIGVFDVLKRLRQRLANVPTTS